jgi:hypothetical protein
MLRVVMAATLVLLVAAPAASAQSPRQRILQECQNGRLSGDYSIGEIRDARNNIPDDIDQYSNCRDVLSRALATRASGGSGGGGGGGDSGGQGGGGGGGSGGSGGGGGGENADAAPLLTPDNDEDKRALEDAARDGGAPVAVGEHQIVPGAAGLASDAARNSLPSTLLIVLILLGLAALAVAIPSVRRGLPQAGPLFNRVVRRGRS